MCSRVENAHRHSENQKNGQNVKYYHSIIGFNGRLDELQAAVLKVKLPHLEEGLEKRRSLAQAYNDGLPEGYIKPQEMPWARHVYHLYVVRTPERDRLLEWLQSNGIGAGMHYPSHGRKPEQFRRNCEH